MNDTGCIGNNGELFPVGAIFEDEMSFVIVSALMQLYFLQWLFGNVKKLLRWDVWTKMR